MRIKKVSQTVPTYGQIVDGYSTSTTDAYSCNYVNGLHTIENKTSSIQPDSNFTVNAYSCRKYGKVVNGYLEFIAKNTITMNPNGLVDIASGFPNAVYQNRFLGYVKKTNGTIIPTPIRIGTDGKINFPYLATTYNMATNESVTISFTYISE